MKIAVAGTGYVGLSIAILLSQNHEVTAVDIIPTKVDMINQRKSPIQDEYIEKYLAEKDLHLTATLDAEQAYRVADFVIIATPTNYDPEKNYFDTSAVEAVITHGCRITNRDCGLNHHHSLWITRHPCVRNSKQNIFYSVRNF